MALRLGDIVLKLGGELHGDPDVSLTGLAPLDSASASELSFLSNPLPIPAGRFEGRLCHRVAVFSPSGPGARRRN